MLSLNFLNEQTPGMKAVLIFDTVKMNAEPLKKQKIDESYGGDTCYQTILELESRIRK